MDVLCSACNEVLTLKAKSRLYRRWFKWFSGLPPDMWSKVYRELFEDHYLLPKIPEIEDL